MRALRGIAVAVGLVVAAVPVTAAASQDLLRTPDGAPLSFEKLAPGFERTGQFTVTNPSEGAADLAVQITVTDEDENGCVRPETYVSDEQCEDDGGELGDWLEVEIVRDGDTLWSGRMAELSEPVEMLGSLGAGDSWDLDLTVGLPQEAGNDTMTDRISFDLVAHLSSDLGPDDTDVLGVDASAPDGGTEVAGNSGVPSVVAAGLDLPGIRDLRAMEGDRLLLLAVAGLAVLVAARMTISRVRRS